MCHSVRSCLLSIFVLLFCVTGAYASVYVESADAGQLLPTACIVPGGVNSIHGSISPLGDIDLYRLTFGQAGNLAVSISTPGTWFDTDTTIFDAAGHPVGTYDANSFSLQITPGSYYLGLADWNIVATDASGRWIADDYNDVLDRTGVLGGWAVTSSPLRGGVYDITFSMTTVPEPSAFVALVGPLGAAFLARRRRP